jgi:uncharacterized protein
MGGGGAPTGGVTRSPSDPAVVAAVAAIEAGDIAGLRRALAADRGLARARVASRDGAERTLVHIVADWPGHRPHGAAAVAALVAAGAEVDARCAGPHTETPLHWAASCDDVAVLDALLDAGADLEATGAVIAGGTPLADAVAFAQWGAAHRLVERGAQTTLWQAAALGLADDLAEHLAGEDPAPEALTNALWHACRGGQTACARVLLARGADPRWVGHDGLTPLAAARRAEASDTVAWLEELLS